MLLEYSRIDTLEGVTRTPLNQYDSVILPIHKYLEKYNVDFILGRTITDINFADDNNITVNELIYKDTNGNNGSFRLQEEDLVFYTNGCITDCSDNGDYKTPAKFLPDSPPSFELWRKIAVKKEGLGNPAPFYKRPDETKWYSFTATFKNDLMHKMIEEFSGNKPGSGALMTFKDSSWRMSIVVAAQPHFIGQGDQYIFWGYGLYPDNIGDYIKKPMIDCTGEEILTELIHHLHFENKELKIKDTVVNVIPVMLPYVDALFQPRKKTDRPLVVPEKSTNFALISQFVEIPQDMVFTEEYSVRAARLAVYKLLNLDKKVAPVTEYWKQPKVLIKAISTSYR